MHASPQKMVNRATTPLVQRTAIPAPAAVAAPRASVQLSALRVSSPADPAEREAEQTAQRIVRMPAPEAAPVHVPAGRAQAFRWPHVARLGQGIVQRQPLIARMGEGAPVVTAGMASEISASQAGGAPLPPSVRRFMEPRFRASFADVRVHADDRAAKLSRQMNARAFTVGNQVFFGRGQFRPDSDDGRELIAHELTHTIQQGAAVQRSPEPTIHERSDLRVQRLGMSDALDYFADKANLLPGFRMFTIVVGVNPVNMRAVDRSPANILRAIVEFLPGGALVTQALDNHGVFEKVGAWVSQQLATLGDLGASIKQGVDRFLDGLSWSDIFDLAGVWERAKAIFTAPVGRLIDFVKGLIVGVLKFVKDAVLMPLARLAQGTSGYQLLCMVLGKDPISGQPAPQDPEAIIGGFMTFIGQADVWEKLKSARAIPRASAWFKSAVAGLVGFVQQIPGLFLSALQALEIMDLVLLPRAFAKLAGVFGGFAAKFASWAGDAVWNLLKIIFDVVSPGALAHVKKAGAALKGILKNPAPFVGNLVRAAKLGFQNFADHFGKHFKAGLFEWLTGSLPGVYIPAAFSLVEIAKFALSVLGVSWTQIRGKIVKVLGPNGETIMKGLETVFDVVKALVTGGPAAAWEVIKEKLNDLKDTVIGGITDMVVGFVVKTAVPKLIAMFIPGAGFIPLIVSIYDTVMVFVQKISKIIQVATAFINSIMAIAAGDIAAAAKRVEGILAGLLSLAISFLAGAFGFGKVADKVMGVVGKVRVAVDKALDAAIQWIVDKAKKLFAALFGKKDSGPDTRTDAQKMADLQRAVAEGQRIASDKGSSKRSKKKSLDQLKSTYRLATIELVSDTQQKTKEDVHVRATINPTYDGAGFVIDRFPPEPVVVIDAVIGAPIPRQGMERVLATQPGRERAHLFGPGFGADMPQGVLLAPSEVNQRLQNQGIEHLIRTMYEQRYPGAEFRVVLTATPHPGSDQLARVNYKLHGRYPGEPWTFIFEYTITVGRGASPSVKVLAGEPADMDAVHRFSAGAASVMSTRGA